jgi:hypothetical protein
MLDWIENEKYRLAAKRLCQKLNEKQVYFSGRIHAKLYFHVSSVLTHENKMSYDDVHNLS